MSGIIEFIDQCLDPILHFAYHFFPFTRMQRRLLRDIGSHGRIGSDFGYGGTKLMNRRRNLHCSISLRSTVRLRHVRALRHTRGHRRQLF
ncbi:Uncharacterised protein [Vibrio cholerae]|nr:Uncharacterised protein [Vibrio cholerae]CSC68986.1 Uncharacterised protein [Vibrio cholerae]CSC69878.1 Uncharacterised protein [Vibrio cholerae]CSD09047.1 Uncharacterised protein [Vibrio cholerae]CSI81875.1 Uncharacterised protein [Vibrio cholerae]